MMNALIEAVELALGRAEQNFDKDASVMVQLAAGDWHKLKSALADAKASEPEATVAAPVVDPVVEPLGHPTWRAEEA